MRMRGKFNDCVNYFQHCGDSGPAGRESGLLQDDVELQGQANTILREHRIRVREGQRECHEHSLQYARAE